MAQQILKENKRAFIIIKLFTLFIECFSCTPTFSQKHTHTLFNYNPGSYYPGKLVLLFFILKLDKVLEWFSYLLKVK